MNKELEEALKRVDRCVDYDTIEDFELIKSAIERKEKLEIIEKHPISYYLLKHNANLKDFYFTYEDYLRCVFQNIKEMNFKEEPLTETEFNLLKEMLEEK